MDITLELKGHALAILGTGGHAQTICDELGVRVAAYDPLIAQYKRIDNCVWLIGIGCNVTRKRVAEQLLAEGVEYAYCIDDRGRAYLYGTVILPSAHICPSARVGVHAIINHHATVDHHAVVETYAHIAPGARVLGGATVGEGSLVGANAVVLPNATVPAWKIVRAGSVYPADYNHKRRGFIQLRDNVAVTV